MLKKILFALTICAAFVMPSGAYADSIIDYLDLSPFIPIVLDAMTTVATGIYEFFVSGNKIIYLLIWTFLGLSIGLYLGKMYLPQKWLEFFGFSGGGELIDGKITGTKMFEDILRSGTRAIIASLVLLQLKPIFLTEILVNPFLEFGAIYTDAVLDTVNDKDYQPTIKCPENIIEKGWLSEDSCNFLIQPVAEISSVNNNAIKQGFKFLKDGLRGLMTLIPHGGEDFLNVLTGIILIVTFFSSNLFIAMLIIQGIFNFGIQLILYPFYVLSYVVKPSDKWLDLWPAFSGVIGALKQLIITMVACAFILCINISIVRALFNWNSSVFVVAAGGTVTTNVPQATASTAGGFGEHSVLWLSSILTFYLMFKIFELTRKQLDTYVGKGQDKLYKDTTGFVKDTFDNIKSTKESIKSIKGWFKK